MASLYNQVPSVSAVFSLYSSFSAIMMLLRRILDEFVPKKIQEYVALKVDNFFSFYFKYQSIFTFEIEDLWEDNDNQTFRAAEVYLPTRLNGLSTGKLLVGSSNLKNPEEQPKVGIPVNTKITDDFEGIHLEWTLHTVDANDKYSKKKRYFRLTCKKEFHEKIMTDYFTYVTKSAEKIRRDQEKLYIWTYNKEWSYWRSSIFEHHSTFETLAIEPDLKKTLIDDLDAFSKGKDFFKSVGRSWKRGYLLYGPPGTGKSSIVAAIANYMKYHIYDLQLQSISDDGELRKILTSTRNRSIIIIEDIDCGSHAFQKRLTKEKEEALPKKDKKAKVGISLSGLLNFVDGLWSSCGEERIIIFTTNHKEKLDPALLRPGRMDFHILMDYCKPFAFKKLVAMYLKIDDHVLFDPIEKLVLEVGVTPAEVTQQLMMSKDSDIALNGLLEFLETKKVRKEKDTKVEEDGKTEDDEAKEAKT